MKWNGAFCKDINVDRPVQGGQEDHQATQMTILHSSLNWTQDLSSKTLALTSKVADAGRISLTFHSSAYFLHHSSTVALVQCCKLLQNIENNVLYFSSHYFST